MLATRSRRSCRKNFRVLAQREGPANDNTQISILKLRTGACDSRRSDFFWLQGVLDVLTPDQNSSAFYLFLTSKQGLPFV
ncbi:hypothetical protein M514_00032, partial [Trichuris suis]